MHVPQTSSGSLIPTARSAILRPKDHIVRLAPVTWHFDVPLINHGISCRSITRFRMPGAARRSQTTSACCASPITGIATRGAPAGTARRRWSERETPGILRHQLVEVSQGVQKAIDVASLQRGSHLNSQRLAAVDREDVDIPTTPAVVPPQAPVPGVAPARGNRQLPPRRRPSTWSRSRAKPALTARPHPPISTC